MSIPYTISDTTLSIIFKATPYAIPSDDERFHPLIEAIDKDDHVTVQTIMDAHKAKLADVVGFLGDGVNVEYRYGHVYINGVLDNGSAAARIIKLRQTGLPVKHLMAFLARLQKNPSFRAVTELYDFVERNQLPITPEGKIIAFKVVKANYYDIHSGTFDNSVGTRVMMNRNQVDENSEARCSNGLHICGQSYISQFGSVQRDTDRVMLVEIDPADFVAVPSDYNMAKARVCSYVVIDEMSREASAEFFNERSRVTFDDRYAGDDFHDSDFDDMDEEEDTDGED